MSDWIENEINTIPMALKSYGEIEFQNGIRMFRGGNGAYIAWLSDGPPPMIRGFSSEQEMIGYINQNRPWRERRR